jgi:hypothetical protein
MSTRSAIAIAVAVTTLAGCGGTSSQSSAPTTPAPAQASSKASSQASLPTGNAKPHKPARTQPSAPQSPHATEFNPPGDIPDNAVFVDHTAPGSTVHLTVPEGWARTTHHGVAAFTDKYNSVSVEVRPAQQPPTVASARRVEVPQLRRTVMNFKPGPITEVTRQHGKAVHLAYLMDSAPNPVTGKVVRDAVERFEFWHAGEVAILTLAGPQGADNVDPWQIVSDSLQWR